MDPAKRSWLPVFREGGVNKQSTENFQGSESILYDAILVDTCHYLFVQTLRLYNTKSEP